MRIQVFNIYQFERCPDVDFTKLLLTIGLTELLVQTRDRISPIAFHERGCTLKFIIVFLLSNCKVVVKCKRNIIYLTFCIFLFLVRLSTAMVI